MAVAALVCFAHIRGSSMMLIGSLVVFLIYIFWTSLHGYEMQVLLFFLPWSPLIKMYRGSISFFTIALLLVCLIGLAK